jgi:hypothetical protein
VLAFARAAAWETGGGARPVLAACGVPDGSPRCHRHPRVYTRVQGAMASGTVVPLHKPDRARLPRAWQIGLSPHVAGFDPPAGSARRPGGASFNDTPVRALTPLLYDMSEAAQKAIIAPFTGVWTRASPKGCVWVCPLRGGDAGIGPLTSVVWSHLVVTCCFSPFISEEFRPPWPDQKGGDDVVYWYLIQ